LTAGEAAGLLDALPPTGPHPTPPLWHIDNLPL